MLDNSNHRLIAVLEPVRELLRDIENRISVSSEVALEARLRLDREIEQLRVLHHDR
jgi:hypothetical protein